MAYQSCSCSVTLLCPVYISVFCTPLALSILLHFMLLCVISFQCNIPLLCIFFSCTLPPCTHLNSPPQQQQRLPQQHQPFSSMYRVYISSVPLMHAMCSIPLHAHTMLMSSTSRLLCLIIMITLQLLWWFSHAFNIIGCYAKIPQPLCQLRLFVFSIIVNLMLFVSVTSSFSSGTTPFTFCLIFFYSHPHGGSTSHFLRQKEDTCPSN
jgi:hypothetical protein